MRGEEENKMYTALIFNEKIPSQFLEMNRGCMTRYAVKELDDICLEHEGVAVIPLESINHGEFGNASANAVYGAQSCYFIQTDSGAVVVQNKAICLHQPERSTLILFGNRQTVPQQLVDDFRKIYGTEPSSKVIEDKGKIPFL